MEKMYRSFAYIMAANVEAVATIFCAWYGGNWLNENYGAQFDWLLVTFIIAIIVICFSWYRMFKNLIKKKN